MSRFSERAEPDQSNAPAHAEAPYRAADERGVIRTGDPCRAIHAFLVEQAAELLAWVIDAELEQLLVQHARPADATRRAAVVRNGYQPPRELQTGLGPVTVRIPKIRSRGSRQVRFHSRLAPPYMRRAWVPLGRAALQYLRGVRSGDLHSTITALMGPEAAALPSPVMRQVSARWNAEHRSGLTGSLADLAVASVWLGSFDDEDADRSVLAAIATGTGRDRLVTFSEGDCGSVAAWSALLRGMRARGLRATIQWMATGDVASVVEQAIAQASPIEHR